MPTESEQPSDFALRYEALMGRWSHPDRLRERLKAMLPARPDGSIPLTALAWAIVGQRVA